MPDTDREEPLPPPPETPSGLIGRTLGGYRIQEKVGEGGMGAVFRARDTGLDRIVAIKVLPAAFAHDERYRARFLREARALARVKHPNLVPIYAVADEQGVYYFAMEFVEGESLRRRIATGGPMPLGEMLCVAGQVLGALAAVHATGITHRDVKSSNIMIEPSGRAVRTSVGPDLPGRAVLMDLGLAKDEASQALTTAGMILGTPEFMSPEQAEGVPATSRSDIYSFGIVLYEMATGSVPFRGKSAIVVLRQQVDKTAPSVSEARPDLPPEFSEAVALALAKKPEDRPGSAQALASFLLRAGRTPELEALAATPGGGVTLTAAMLEGAHSTAPAIADATARTITDTGPGSAERTAVSGRGRGRGLVAGIVLGAVVLVVLLGLLYERLTRPEAEKKAAPVAGTEKPLGEPETPAPKETVRRANVLARDGTVLWRNVRVIAVTEDGVIIEEADGNRRAVLYESNPTFEYLLDDATGDATAPAPKGRR